MRTLITLENGNCTRCHNSMLGKLREKEGVRRVESDFSSQCLVIDHEGDPEVLVSLITAADRGIFVAANGEREMVRVGGHEAQRCRTAPRFAQARPDDATPAMAQMPAIVQKWSGAPGAAAPDTRSRQLSDCPVCHPDGTRRGSGVRVLTRERPAPGLALRAVRFIIRMYRVIFRLTVAPR